MICLIMKVLLSLRSVLALSERLRRVVSIVGRHSVRRATLDDRESIGVALVCPRNEDAAAAPAVCFQR
jgi:hypothetical protein